MHRLLEILGTAVFQLVHLVLALVHIIVVLGQAVLNCARLCFASIPFAATGYRHLYTVTNVNGPEAQARLSC
jgi:hypothetical protein